DIIVAADLRDKGDPEILGMNDKNNQYHEFFQNCCNEFQHVLYVAGNHESYHGDFSKTIPHLREKLSYLKNLHILDKESMRIDDVIFFGGTLWTDMNRGDPLTLSAVARGMNDFRCVTNEQVGAGCRFLPEDAVEDHKTYLEKLSVCLQNNPNDKFVVVGHHAPSKESTKPKYHREHLINGAYSSELSNFILDNRNIKVWVHGHTHDLFDYMIGTTRIICNPRGYKNWEDIAETFELAYFDV
ncbi:MAG: hypothetical protein EBU90_21700, partial [Proteobacteria bacterium]|nr:hypothetical protein [Pseudomonadota bacterium]